MAKKRPQAMPVAKSGMNHAALPVIGMTADPYNPDPMVYGRGSGGDYRQTADQVCMIENDPQVTSTMQTRKSALASLPICVDVEDGAPADLKDEVEDMLEGIEDMRSFISSMLDAVLFGYEVCEVTWDYVDGKLKPVDLIARPRCWYGFNGDGQLCLRKDTRLVQIDEDGEYYGCYLVASYNAANNDRAGRGLARAIWYPVWATAENFKLWLILNDKHAFPTVVCKTSAGEAQRQRIRDQLKRMTAQGVIVHGVDEEIKYLQVDKTAAELFAELIRQCEARIAKVIVGQTMTSGDVAETGSGSYASAKVGHDVLGSIVAGDAAMIGNLLTRLARWYVEFNYSKEIARLVTVGFDFGDEPVSALERSNTIRNLALAGIKIDTSAADFREVFETPEPTGPDDVLVIGTGSVAPFENTATGGNNA